MTSKQRALLLASAALGLGASSTSSYVHYKLLTEPSYSSVCDVNATVNCAQAYLSQYGSFMGVPVAVGGVMFFATVLALVAAGGRTGSPVRESVPGYVFALSTIGLAFVLYLAWAAYFVLKTFCIFCALTYVAVIALFVVSGAATTYPMTTLPRRATRDARALFSSPVSLVVLLLLVGGAGSLLAFFPREGASRPTAQATFPPLTDQQRTAVEQWWDVQPKKDVPIPADGAKVLIVKFSDFQCPGCRTTHDAYKPIFDKWVATGQVRYVLKHFPLEPECNPGGAAGGNHFASCEASAAVVMASRKGQAQADAMTDWLFEHQPTLSPSVVRQGARDVAGIEDFDQRYAAALQEVKADATLGTLLEVKSTPTFFINGRSLGGVQPQAMDALIELELKRAK